MDKAARALRDPRDRRTKRWEDLAPTTRRMYEYQARRRRLTPRMAHALRMYSLGIAKTMKEAALMIGATPVAVQYAAMSLAGKELMAETNDQVERKVINVAALIDALSVRAVGTIGHLMENGSTEEMRFKAAVDLADRGPRTSKTQKISSVGLTLAGKDIEALTRAMVEASKIEQLYPEARVGDFVKVQDPDPADSAGAANTKEVR